MTHLRKIRRRILPGVGVVAVLALVLVACTPEPTPPPPPAPPTTAPPARPECGSVAAGTADGTAITVRDAGGRTKVVTVPAGGDVDAKVARLEAEGKGVVAVEAEVAVSVAQTDGNVDDPFFNAGGGGGQFGLWGIKRIDAPEAWGSGTLQQGQGVKVAVIDTGVQGDHPGLAGRVTAGIDLVVGAPFDGRTDGNGHGTHVAGTIAEVDNTSGGIGVAPQATIVPVRVLGCTGGGSSSDVANGIYWAVDTAQVDVINMSLGTGAPSSTILLAVEHALANGVVVAAAGGNGGTSSCPPDTPVTTTTSSSSTSSSTSSTSSPSSTTSPPVSTPVQSAASAATTVPTTAPTAPTEAPAAAEAAPDAPQTLEAVVIAACNVVPTYSNPLYPAAYAIGRPGLIAVAATGDGITLANPAAAGTITWLEDVGDFVEKNGAVATIGASTILTPEAGVVTARLVASGTVTNGTAFVQMISADRRAPYSNVNQYITVAAPGGGVPPANNGIYSTIPGSAYGYKSGTSMATPHVAGVAALILARCPSLTPVQVMNRITSTAEDLGQIGWDAAFGAGMVQAGAAVAPAC